MLIGVIALVYSGYVVEDAQLYQQRAGEIFERIRAPSPPETQAASIPAAFVTDTSASSVVAPGSSASAAKDSSNALPDGVIGRLLVPRIGLTVMVAEGDSSAVLRRAVGHLSDTPLPGQPGNVVFAGHRDTFFRPLRNIRLGDTITIQTVDNSYQYRVEWFRVMPPDNVSVLAPSQSNELTLITCFPFDFVGSAPDRFVVRAEEIRLGGRSLSAERSSAGDR
jgi:sortase A